MLGKGVLPGLLLAKQRIFVLALGFQHNEGKALFVQEKKIYKAGSGLVKIIAQTVKIRFDYFYRRLKYNVRLAVRGIKKSQPASS